MCASVRLLVVALVIGGATALAAGDAPVKPVVRVLTFDPADPNIPFRIGGLGKLVRLADAAAVERLVGKDAAGELIKQVHFPREAIVLISWTTTGPPEGVLRHAVAADGAVRFHVQAPQGNRRGQRARIGADFFAVPAGARVTFDATER